MNITKVILDPYGDERRELPPSHRVRFVFGVGRNGEEYIEVYANGDCVTVRSSGWLGGILVKPHVANEITVEPTVS